MPRTAELEPLVTRVLAPNPSRDDPRRHQHLRRRRAGQRPGRAGRPRARTTPRTWPRWRRPSPRGTPGASPCWSPTTTATTRRRRCPGARASAPRSPPQPRDVAGPRRPGARAGGAAARWPARRSTSSPRPGTPPTTWPSGWSRGAVLVGDHVLGRGTSVVTHPEGDVVAYLESLRRVHDLGPSALYCGHGPELTEDPGAVLDFYLAHRAYREEQLLGGAGRRPAHGRRAGRRPSTPTCPREVWPAAAQSTRATLGQAARRGPGRGGTGRTGCGRHDRRPRRPRAPTASATSGGRPRRWPAAGVRRRRPAAGLGRRLARRCWPSSSGRCAPASSPSCSTPGCPAAERAALAEDADPALDVGRRPRPAAGGDDEAELADVPLARPMHYTSGTTGRRKGVWSGVLADDDARALAAEEIDLWGFEPGRPAPGALPAAPQRAAALRDPHAAGRRRGAAARPVRRRPGRRGDHRAAGRRRRSACPPTCSGCWPATTSTGRPSGCWRTPARPCPRAAQAGGARGAARRAACGSSTAPPRRSSPSARTDDWLAHPGSVGRAAARAGGWRPTSAASCGARCRAGRASSTGGRRRRPRRPGAATWSPSATWAGSTTTAWSGSTAAARTWSSPAG